MPDLHRDIRKAARISGMLSRGRSRRSSSRFVSVSGRCGNRPGISPGISKVSAGPFRRPNHGERVVAPAHRTGEGRASEQRKTAFTGRLKAFPWPFDAMPEAVPRDGHVAAMEGAPGHVFHRAAGKPAPPQQTFAGKAGFLLWVPRMNPPCVGNAHECLMSGRAGNAEWCDLSVYWGSR